MDGLVFDIQRFSIHDGPGIRTTVFFQGCNLRCFWCHNPESQPLSPRVQFFPDKCIVCAACVEHCPHHAHLMVDGRHIYVRDRCQTCGACVEQCFAQALIIKAKKMTVEQVMADVERDQAYYVNSHGGVTFSGGEPTLQAQFLLELLRASKERGFHTAVDTAANVPWRTLEQLIPTTDLFLVDLKAFDEEKHRAGTGVSNRRILENIRRLGQGSATVWIRVPVVPGYNDDAAELGKMAAFLADLPAVRKVELLPFHHLGASKYESLGLDYPSRGLKPPGEEAMASFATIFARCGLPVAGT